MKRLAFLLASMALVLLAGCGGGGKGSPENPPADFRVQAGDGSVIVTWTAEPDTEYWIFFGVGPDITTDNWLQRGGAVITNAQSPRIITGLQNGTTYSFTINARKNKGAGGSGAPSIAVVPSLAGETWTPRPALGTQDLRAITAGNLLNGFAAVIVGDGGSIHSSISATEFTPRTNPVPGVNLHGAVYGAAAFLALGDNGTILKSTDSITWTAQTSGTTARLNGGAVNSLGVFAVVGAGGVIAASQDQGTTWSTPGSGVNTDLFGATWGVNRYVAVGAQGVILVGESGSDWNRVGSDLTTNALRGAAFGAILAPGQTTAQNIFVAVGDAGTVLKSEDAVTWTLVPAFTNKNLLAVVFGGRFVAVGEDGVIFTSADGVAWESRNSNTTADLTSVAREVAGYTAVGEAGTIVSTFQ